MEPTKDIFLRASRAKKEYLAGDDLEKREIAEKILWNPSMQNQKVASHKLKQPYEWLSLCPKNASFETKLRAVEAVRTWLRGNLDTFSVPKLAPTL